MTHKDELIAKYRDKPVTHFAQYDGFVDVRADCFFAPDDDGDALFGPGETHELMTFDDGVRVLIADGTEPEAAERVLRKIADWVAEDLKKQREKRARRERERRFGPGF